MNTQKGIWEILVPTVSNAGKPFRTRFHKVWDAEIRNISGGLTILKPAKGQWISPDGSLYAERMIPVRIICTADEMEKIISLTMKYYDQEAILAYKISNEFILRHKNEKRK